MGLVKDDFERLHNHTGEAINYFFRLILSVLIIMFDGLYRACKRLRESTYTVEAVHVERGINIEPQFRVGTDLASSFLPTTRSLMTGDIPLGKYSFNRWEKFGRWHDKPASFDPTVFRYNEMLKEELILSDKPAKGKIKVWKAANQV